jgi:hypothetical protein
MEMNLFEENSDFYDIHLETEIIFEKIEEEEKYLSKIFHSKVSQDNNIFDFLTTEVETNKNRPGIKVMQSFIIIKHTKLELQLNVVDVPKMIDQNPELLSKKRMKDEGSENVHKFRKMIKDCMAKKCKNAHLEYIRIIVNSNMEKEFWLTTLNYEDTNNVTICFIQKIFKMTIYDIYNADCIKNVGKKDYFRVLQNKKALDQIDQTPKAKLIMDQNYLFSLDAFILSESFKAHLRTVEDEPSGYKEAYENYCNSLISEYIDASPRKRNKRLLDEFN